MSSSPSPTYYSVSDLIAWRTCPYLYITKRTLGLGIPPGPALQLGTLAHQLYEAHQTPAWPTTVAATTGQALFLEPKDREKYDRLLAGMDAFTPPWTRLPQREISLRMPLTGFPNTYIVGRLDGLCRKPDNTLWSEQLKTIDMSHDAAAAVDRVRRSHHEITYNVLWHHTHSTQPLSGIQLVLARKRPTKSDPAVFSTHEIDLTHSEALELFRPIEAAFVELHLFTISHTKLPVLRDYSSCHTPYGTCGFKPHCHHGVRLEALTLVPAPARYSESDFS